MRSGDRGMIGLVERYRDNQVAVQRVVIGALYLWFGALKLVPGLSPVDHLAGRAMSAMTFGLVGSAVSMPLLAVMEVLIGVGLVSGKLVRTTLATAAVHLAGVLLTLVVLPHDVWSAPGVPTLDGQYVLKNAVLVCGLANVAVTAFRKAPEKAVVPGQARLVDELGQQVRR